MKSTTLKSVDYVGDFKLKLTFGDGVVRHSNFIPVLETYATGEYARYKKEKHFKEFSIESGNLVWGENWDLIFPLAQLHESRIRLHTQTENDKKELVKSIQSKLNELKSDELQTVQRLLHTMSRSRKKRRTA